MPPRLPASREKLSPYSRVQPLELHSKPLHTRTIYISHAPGWWERGDFDLHNPQSSLPLPVPYHEVVVRL